MYLHCETTTEKVTAHYSEYSSNKLAIFFPDKNIFDLVFKSTIFDIIEDYDISIKDLTFSDNKIIIKTTLYISKDILNETFDKYELLTEDVIEEESEEERDIPFEEKVEMFQYSTKDSLLWKTGFGNALLMMNFPTFAFNNILFSDSYYYFNEQKYDNLVYAQEELLIYILDLFNLVIEESFANSSNIRYKCLLCDVNSKCKYFNFGWKCRKHLVKDHKLGAFYSEIFNNCILDLDHENYYNSSINYIKQVISELDIDF
uniref:Uncharacterized protein n=1 Tax=Pithovirus LCDPAC02 TaxID=2506601 RepID=A0A481YP51_9VIRU|nr:MAG: hypothetical protein LCDPAC02_02920 [Pithovirus LCDPAC02]